MYLLLDTETTSYKPWQIAQLSCLLLDNERNIVQAKNFFFSVEEMDPYAQAIHWFSLEQLEELSEGYRFGDHINSILPLIENTTLIAHNVQFDLKFMQHECNKINIDYNPKTLCSMEYFTPICKIPHPQQQCFKWPKVAELMTHFDISHEDVQHTTKELFDTDDVNFHDARYDTVAVYLAMKIHKNLEKSSQK